MKKTLTILCVIFFLIKSHGQDSGKITLNFKDTTLLEVINSIESKTDYKFFFLKNWLGNKRYSGNYKNVNIEVLLDNLLNDTNLNYYITNDLRVIITKNLLIRDSIASIFQENNEVENKKLDGKENSSPLFFELNSNSDKKFKTIRIGKEKKKATKKEYTLSGNIKSIESNKPIENLTITNKRNTNYAITDVNGDYTIKLSAGANIIELRALGFNTKKIRIIIYDDGIYNLKIKENAQALDEIVVEANRDRNVKQSITGVTQIKVKDIKNIPLILGERDILKVATTLPGIKKAGEGSAGFNVRGGKADQNLILLDNGVIYNPSHFFGIFSAINPFTTRDVDIYKGHIPAEFGGRLSSVFDIKTKNKKFEKFNGEFSIGPVTSNLTMGIPIAKKKSSLLIGGRSTYSNWVLNAIDNKSLKNSKASFYDIIIKNSNQINENNELDISGYYSNDDFSISSDSIFNYTNRLLTLNWKHKFNKNNSSNLFITNSQYKFDIDYDGKGINDFNLKYKVDETELKLKIKNRSFKKHKIAFGMSSKFYRVSPGSIYPRGNESIIKTIEVPQEQALESAVFFSDIFDLSKNTQLNFGLRYSIYGSLGEGTKRVYSPNLPVNENTLLSIEEFNKNKVMQSYGGPEVRTSLRYSFTPLMSIKSSFNSTFQYIHALSNNTTASPIDTWKLSDFNIKPQRANQYSIGLYKNTEDNVYELSLEGYYKKSKNILDYKIGADLLLNKYVETEVLQGDGRAYGVEFLVKKNKGKLNGWLSYSYSRAFLKLSSEFNEERVNNGNYFPANYDKPHDFSLISNYKLTKRYSFSANFTYQTGRPVTYPVGKFIFNGEEKVLYSDRNKFRIPDYYRLDLGINIEGNHKIKKFAHSFWNISVYNILGRNNPYSVFFVTENGEIKAYKSSIFSVPIPTITYNFRF